MSNHCDQFSDSDSDSTQEQDSTDQKDITSVDLGFIESDPEDDAFHPQAFPSKIGGKPVWLDPRCVVDADFVKCGVCSGPMQLLTQLYAPIPNRETDAYHRTVFIFMCPRSECCSRNSNKNFTVFRSQLPKINPIYPLSSATAEDEKVYAAVLPQLCTVCGVYAPFRCSRCKRTSYCCRPHQTQHWKKGGHKENCNDAKSEHAQSDDGNLTFQEFEVYTEPEPVDDDGDEDTDLDAFSKEQTQSEETDYNLESLVKAASNKDSAFLRFINRVKRRPSQIIRYELGSSLPLWPSSEDRPKDIPNCHHCGAKRQFEFQIMPQLLTHLSLDEETIVGSQSIDWATLAIYTCSANCDTVKSEKNVCLKEYLWKQDYSV